MYYEKFKVECLRFKEVGKQHLFADGAFSGAANVQFPKEKAAMRRPFAYKEYQNLS
ncbi:MAG: hypothetical protein ACO1OO_06530 [Flavisolibacter sp.]